MRGAVPVSLALGLPADLPGKNELVNITFGIVLLSLLGQGLSLPAVISRLGLERKEKVQQPQIELPDLEPGGIE